MMKTYRLFLLSLIITIIIGFTTPADATQRLKYTGIARSTGGAVLGSATVTIYLAGTTTPANVYEASTGGDSVTSVTSDSNGRWTFYADVADYAFTQEYKVVVTKDGYSTITLDNIFNLSLPTDAAGSLINDGLGAYSWGTPALAATASALAANPTDCSANQFATTIAANGNLTCAALTDADVPADLTISGGTVNNSIIGGSVAAAGSFTTLGASGLVTANAGIDVKNGDTGVGFVKIYEDSDDGTNYVAIKSQAMAASYDVVLPDAVPTGIVRADEGVVTASNTLSTVTINGGTASTVAVWDGSQNLTSLTSQNMVTTGQIDGRVKVVVATDTVTIDASASNQAVYYINGADSARTFNLPAAVAGLAYCFANALYAKALTVDPAAGDKIILAGVAADAGEYVESTSAAATDKICVLAIDTTYWLVTASTGTWAQDTP